MKKVFLVFIVIFLLTGCTGEYNVVINEDLTIEEEINVIGDDRFKIGGEYTESKMFTTLTQTYTEFYDESKVGNYNYDTASSGNIKGNYENKYNNLEDWKNSYYIKKFFPNLNIETEDNTVNISSGNIDSFWLFLNGMEEDPLLHELVIKIKVPYAVTFNNADEVDDKNNVYTYKYDFQSSSKKILLEFDKSQKFNKPLSTTQTVFIVIIGIGIIALAWFIYFKVSRKAERESN